MVTFRHQRKSGKKGKRHSFALTEVCIALIVIGISISYVFSAFQQTITRYSTLLQEISCHKVADEQLARFLATFLTNPPDFDTASAGSDTITSLGKYEVRTTMQVQSSEEKDKETGKEAVKKACLMTIRITAQPVGNDAIRAVRATTLCIVKEGA